MYKDMEPGYYRRMAYSMYLNQMHFCPICQKHIKIYEYSYRLNCTHIFHTKCISTWFDFKKMCPLCKSTDLKI